LGRVWIDCFYVAEKQNQSRCTFKYKQNFTRNKVVEKCAEYCPLECDSTFYTYSLSSGYDRSIEDITTFRLFYSTLKVTKISQKPKAKIFDLISTIGGILGIFIGLTFVSIFELGEILIEIVYSIFSIRERNNKIFIETIEKERINKEIRDQVKNQLKIELEQNLTSIKQNILDQLREEQLKEKENKTIDQ